MLAIIKLFTEVTDAIANIQASPTLKPAFEQQGFGDEELTNGQNMADELSRLYDAQIDAEVARKVASAAYKTLWNTAQSQFSEFIQVGRRRAFRGNTEAQLTLDFSAQDEQTFAQWLVRARSFYRHLLANPAYLKAMAKVGLPEDILKAGRAAAEAAEEARIVFTRAEAEAQQATQVRNLVKKDVQQWFGDLKQAGDLGIKDPALRQELEKIGIKVK